MAKNVPTDPHTRHKTRYRGITYRVRADGSRTYFVYASGKQLPVEGGEREALDLQAELRRRPKGTGVVSNVRFGDLSEEWFASKHKLKPWTLTCYRDALDRIVLPRFGRLKLSAITTQEVAKFIRELEARGLSSSTTNNYMLPLTGTLSMAVSRGLIQQNVCKLLTKDERPAKKISRKQDHVWNDDEIAALLDASAYLSRQPASQYNYEPILRLAVFTGLRLGELLGLQWQDLDLDARELHVRRQWTRAGQLDTPKTEAALRRIPLSDDLVTFLREHHKRALIEGKAGSFVFISRSGGPLSHRNVQRRAFEPAAALAEIEGVSFHSLRHAFASRMISRGISATVLARLMGHESSAITERRYIHLFDVQRTDDAVRIAMAQ
jgi:integrase